MQRTQRMRDWLIAAAVIAAVSADAQAAKVAGHVETGALYDSNLNVDELDQASDRSDHALLIDAGAEASGHPLDNLTLTGTYDFTSRNYASNDRFDQTIHLASVDLSYDIDSVTVGASHHYSHATLDSEPFLDYHRTSVYMGKLIDDDVYVMVSLLSKRKSFDHDQARDAHTRGVALDNFFFFNQRQTLLVFGLESDHQTARSDAYDYLMLAGRARVKHHFMVSGHRNTVQAGVRYEARDYDEPVSSVDNPMLPLAGPTQSNRTRTDGILNADIRWSVGLTDWLTTEAKVEHTDYRSTLDSAEYAKTVASLTLRVDF